MRTKAKKNTSRTTKLNHHAERVRNNNNNNTNSPNPDPEKNEENFVQHFFKAKHGKPHTN